MVRDRAPVLLRPHLRRLILAPLFVLFSVPLAEAPSGPHLSAALSSSPSVGCGVVSLPRFLGLLAALWRWSVEPTYDFTTHCWTTSAITCPLSRVSTGRHATADRFRLALSPQPTRRLSRFRKPSATTWALALRARAHVCLPRHVYLVPPPHPPLSVAPRVSLLAALPSATLFIRVSHFLLSLNALSLAPSSRMLPLPTFFPPSFTHLPAHRGAGTRHLISGSVLFVRSPVSFVR